MKSLPSELVILFTIRSSIVAFWLPVLVARACWASGKMPGVFTVVPWLLARDRDCRKALNHASSFVYQWTKETLGSSGDPRGNGAVITVEEWVDGW